MRKMNKRSGYLPRYKRCFICGDRKVNPFSMSIRFYWDGEKIDTVICPHDYYMGFDKIVHGGVQTALMDEAMGWAITMEIGTFVLTRKLSVEFLCPMITNKEYRLIARATKHTKRISYAEGRIIDKSTDKVVAEAEGTFFRMKDEQARQVNDYLIYQPGDVGCLFKRTSEKCG
ncbi:MAG: hypothetical protein DRG83_04915 [Deltaproteobacteria bacterium]|nr:MAG: hypothetical protein DRG83_04915 [Deltaproteobacteria bacterium]